MEKTKYSLLIANAKSVFDFERTLPYRMNVIRSAARGRLKEIAHSMILADLLHDNSILYDFLKEFLPSCCSNAEEVSQYEIRREFNHIDICLENKTNFIIIENKVNGAVEQDGQIIRYVSEAHKINKHIYVLYLKSIDKTMPSERSTKDNKGNDVFSLMKKEDFIVLSYLYDILPWLGSIESKIKEQKYLKTSLYQYIDYLKMKYDLADDNNLKIMEQIDYLLNINPNSDADFKIDKYNEQFALVSCYSEQLRKAKWRIVNEQVTIWREELIKIYENTVELRKNPDDDATGWRFYIKHKIEVVFSTDGGRPFWGISLKEDEKIDEHLGKLKQYFKKGGDTDYWTFWDWTTFGHIMDEVRNMYDRFKELELV